MTRQLTIKNTSVYYACFFLLSWILTSHSLLSQTIHKTTLQIQYTVSNGLPSAETYDVFQDSKGYIWIGTDKGVAKYDGTQFQTYTTNDGLTDNTVFRFFEDDLNRVWCITYNRRLCYFKDGIFQEYPYNDVLVESLSEHHLGKTITDLKIKPNGSIEVTLTHFLGVQIDSNGQTSDLIAPYYHHALDIFNNAVDEEDLLQKITPLMNLYYPTTKFTAKYLGKCNLNFQFFSAHLIQLGENGAILYNQKTNTIESKILRKYHLTGMTQDFEGGLWFSTLNSGVIFIPNPLLDFYSTTSQSFTNYLQGVFLQDTIPVYKFSPDKNYFLNEPKQVLQPLAYSDDYHKIPKDVRKIGLKFENAIKIPPFPQKTKSIVQIDDSTVIYSANSPISFIFSKLKTNKLSNQRIVKGPIVNRIIVDSKDSVWLGTVDGLMKLNEDTLLYFPYPKNHVLSKVSVQDLAYTSDSILIIASRVNGLFYQIGDSIVTFNENSGLISNTINQIQFDTIRNLIWVATTKGICSLKWCNGKISEVIHVLNSTSGLISTDIRQFFLTSEALYFGTNSGICKINIDELDKQSPPPKLYLNSILVNNQTWDIAHPLTLNYDQNALTFNFSGISFNSFSDITYQFYIDGLDQHWNSSKYPELAFYSLNPGKYTLHVRATNTNNVQSEVIRIEFTIEPAYWMTLWFKTLGVSILLIIILISTQQFVKRFKTKAKLEIDNQRLTSMNLQSKMNPHFIFNSLNSIQHYIMSNNPLSANDYLIDFSSLIRQVLKNSNSPEIILAEEITTIELYVALEKRRLNNSFDFSIEIDPSIRPELCTIPALLLQPFIENSIWHGKLNTTPNSHLILRIQLFNDILYFEIEDNGIGYENAIQKKKETKKQSFGTYVTKERIKLISRINTQLSEVMISPARTIPCTPPNEGTLIQFNIPYYIKKSLK